MFRRVEDAKCIIVDVDSFIKIDYNELNELSQIIKCIFISSNLQIINLLNENIDNTSVLYIPSYMMWTLPNVSFINSILEKNGVEIIEICFLTHSYKFAEKALHFLSPVILISNEVTYEQVSALPDLVRSCMADVIDSFKTDRKGYCGELSYESSDPKGVVLKTKIGDLKVQSTLFVLGRYYSSDHYLHNFHDYSVAILKNKSQGSRIYGKYNDNFSKIFVSSAEIINNKYHLDCVCSVPNRPSSKNRFSFIINKICKAIKTNNISDFFICVKDYAQQKGLSAEEKENNVKGVFQYTQNDIKGKNILLIDDIISTGATIKECVRVLLDNGASNVYCLVLAVNQYPQIDYWTYLYPNLKCPVCSKNLTLQINSNNKSKFYSCLSPYYGLCDFQPISYDSAQKEVIAEETRKILEQSYEVFSDAIPREINSKCPYCGSDNIFSEEECNISYDERQMGREKLIEMNDFEIMCLNCNKTYYVNGYISEYPEGSIECEEITESKEPNK